jgi:hypothetical protein
MGMFVETVIVTVYHLPTKENKLPFSVWSKKRKFVISIFCMQQTNGSFRFLLVPFSVCVYVYVAVSNGNEKRKQLTWHQHCQRQY